jgi:hypothetical protein
MDLLKELGIELWDLEDLIRYYHPNSCSILLEESHHTRRFVENNSLILPDFNYLVTYDSGNNCGKRFYNT